MSDRPGRKDDARSHGGHRRALRSRGSEEDGEVLVIVVEDGHELEHGRVVELEREDGTRRLARKRVMIVWGRTMEKESAGDLEEKGWWRPDRPSGS